MRRPAALLVLILAMGACSAAPPAAPPAPSAGVSVEPPPDGRRLAIYEPLIRELVGGEDLGPGGSWSRVVIDSNLCQNAAEPFPRTRCREGFSEDEQVELARRLAEIATTIRFVADPRPTFDVGDTIVVRMGPIEARGDRVAVGGSYLCGGLCGSGTTYLLDERANGWKIVGTTGPGWIA
jgi:hypothetical protein